VHQLHRQRRRRRETRVVAENGDRVGRFAHTWAVPWGGLQACY
jgi:uncharacterized protein (DUF2384 family)